MEQRRALVEIYISVKMKFVRLTFKKLNEEKKTSRVNSAWPKLFILFVFHVYYNIYIYIENRANVSQSRNLNPSRVRHRPIAQGKLHYE